MRTRVTTATIALVLLVGAAACEPLPAWWPTARATPELQQTAFKQPLVGDYDADGLDDIFWYAPDPWGGDTTEELWWGRPGGGFTKTSAPSVYGVYRPVVLDLTGDGGADILWYAAQGRSTVWLMGEGGLEGRRTFLLPTRVDWLEVIPNAEGSDDLVLSGSQLDGTPLHWDTDAEGPTQPQLSGGFQGSPHAIPVAGDFDGDGRGDVLLHGQGAAIDVIWWGRPDGGVDDQRITDIAGSYVPLVLDGDGDGRDDIAFFTDGAGASSWAGQAGRWFRRSSQPVPPGFHGALVQRSHEASGRDSVLLFHERDVARVEAWTIGPDGRATARPVETLFGKEPLLGRFSADGIRDDVYLYDAAGRDTLYLSPRAA